MSVAAKQIVIHADAACSPARLYPPDIWTAGLRTTAGHFQARSASDIWSAGRRSLEIRNATRNIIAPNTLGIA